MTTIVYRDGALWGDSLVVVGSTKVGLMEKVWKTKKGGCLCGGAGDVEAVSAFRRWTEGGMRGPFKEGSKDFDGIIIEAEGKILVISGEHEEPSVMAALMVAIGSGSELALGAMAVGAPPEVALQVAMDNDVNTGGPKQCVKLDSLLEAEAIVAQAKAEQEAKLQAAAEAEVARQTQEVAKQAAVTNAVEKLREEKAAIGLSADVVTLRPANSNGIEHPDVPPAA